MSTVLHTFNCFYTNADQLHNKLDELKVRIRDTLPKVIGVTEVKPKNCRYPIAKAEFSLDEIDKYQMFTKNIDNTVGRGMILYINDKLKATEISMETKFQENIFVNIKLNQTDKLLVGLIYRSPSDSGQDYNGKLRELIHEACNKKFSHLLLMGDLNYPDIDWDTWDSKGDSTDSIEYKFVECLQDNFLYQHITKPTRCRGSDRPNVLDLVLTNEEGMISKLEYFSPLGKSDHCVITFDFKCYMEVKKYKPIKLFNKGRYQEFREELAKLKWEEILAKQSH